MKPASICVLLLFLFGCNDDVVVDCDGFSGEPSLQFKASTNDTLAIFFLNTSGNGDTMYANNGELLNIPVDLNSDTMFLELIADSSLGKLVLSYKLEQKLCATSDELKIHFQSARFTEKSTFLNMKTIENGSASDFDTSYRYASFINQTRINRYFEVAL